MISVTLDFDEERVADLLIPAFESGIGYWCRIDRHAKPLAIVLGEASALLAEVESLTRRSYTLDRKAIIDGLTTFPKVAPRHFAQWMKGNEDAETGDVFLQCCLFGEVRYG